MRQFYFLSILFVCSISVYAQKNGSVKGIAYDTLSGKPVPDATITVLVKKDSSLFTFGMTDNAGRFLLDNIPMGEYRLLITHVGYHNSNKNFTLSENEKNIDLGNIVMNDRTKVLEEVLVTNEAPPVTLIGDTVQYNAGSFKTQPNASVEQLLKKLPGVEVGKDGSVKAQGQTVNKVLVDGKEFFGNDPKMATKNLPADAIDKVQVYDKLSDQAQMTGFDDGNSEKTINLKLKKDKKKGAFGKITGGAGTDERFEGRFNVNSFKGARQMSAIGMVNNTNAEGFSFMDMMNFTGELGRMMRGGNGNININITADDPNAALLGANNSGIRTIWGGGLNYNNIIGNKIDFTSNYFYNHYNPKTESNIQRQYILPDSSYFYNQNSLSNNINNSHRLNLGFDYVIDSFHSIKVSPSLGYQQTKNNSLSDYQQTGESGELSNNGYSHSITNSTAYNFRNDLLFRKKFRRRGRTFSLSLQTTLNSSDGDGSLESVNEFFNRSGSGSRTDSINQLINNQGNLRGYTARAVYTEPIFKRSLLEFSIGKSDSKSTNEKVTYDYNKGNGKYDQLNDSLTNDFQNIYGYTNAGIRLRTQKKKYNYAIGLSWQQAELEGKITTGVKDSVITKSFTNLLPTARFQYNFTRYKNLTINYRAFTNQPSVSQLQPVPDISNALNIKEGNPELKQEFTHNVQINYMGVNPFKNKNLFAFFNLSRTDNKIVNADTLYSSGIKKTKPVNVDGVYNLNGDINLGLPARFLKGTLRIGTNLGYNRGRQFINNIANTISTFSAGPRLGIDMSPTEKIDLSFSAGMNYNKTKYSLQPVFNTSYFSQLYETEFNWQLPKGFYFSTDFVYTINNQLADGFNAQVPLWNASLSKQFLRFNRGELKLRVNDILNRNIGVSRSTNQNYIEDSRVNTLRRFALLTFTYSLSKTGLNSGKGGDIRVIRR
ncbi:MAG TPA: outer membrane beta-barrel family protein [Chitinophagaceae bacterium]|nr:outer membrane beta-barrel family protein [Chitinophagaceae bacterium]